MHTGGVHQLETGADGAVRRRRRRGRRGRPVADPGGRGAQAERAGPAERLPGGARGPDAGHVHQVPVRAAPVRAAAVRVQEQAGAPARRVAVLPVAVRPADRAPVPGERDGARAPRRRRRDVRRVRRVRRGHARHRVQRALGPGAPAVPAVRRRLRLHRPARVAVPGRGLPAAARGRRARRPVPARPRQQHVRPAAAVLRVPGPRHRAPAVRHIRAGLQAVRLRAARRAAAATATGAVTSGSAVPPRPLHRGPGGPRPTVLFRRLHDGRGVLVSAVLLLLCFTLRQKTERPTLDRRYSGHFNRGASTLCGGIMSKSPVKLSPSVKVRFFFYYHG